MDNLHNKAVINLMLTGNYVVENINSFLKVYDLTVQQFNILRILRGQDGLPINLYELQDHMIHKMSNTTRLVEKLRKKELLERKVCESNRRKIEILITDKGLGLLAGIDQSLIDFEKNLVHQLSREEIVKLLELLNKVKIKS
ncbi:MarR family transcriptional regulator [Wenyingzhuangia fucanilytica]|uniref:MarR family transcriptional regulator n=1 Tax=Wenyingzhuangia fucanilytica TaxID=1790137 RepID=A0A1B1Y3W6_9FLAO|nr:MarR family transcriptional regulator [Wenyingzhuangia fucanilytica]ANW95438.1 MarR family transcriptional regulator [Wenyingzhuangia fucanilytica]